MLMLIDNYDSFTFNLAQYLGELGADVRVWRNDELSLDEIQALRPAQIVISPGPCTPTEAGRSPEIIQRFGSAIPTLGVCLGHQCIGAVFGGVVERAPEIMHGKTSMIRHLDGGVFSGLPDPFEATRYHSLIVREQGLPKCLEKTAWTEETNGAPSLIMGLRHREHPIWGVQFHPESILTGEGKNLLQNFLEISAA